MNKYILIGIALVFAAQLYVPASLIFRNDDILNTGAMYKLRTAPIDPIDPLRGKYVLLNFDISRYTMKDTLWKSSEEQTVYVVLTTDNDGYGVIKEMLLEEPNNGEHYVKATAYGWDQNLNISYTFNRFYMEESKAYPAETLYREARRDREQNVYAEVYVKKGKAALKQVYINEVPLKEAVESYMDSLLIE